MQEPPLVVYGETYKVTEGTYEQRSGMQRMPEVKRAAKPGCGVGRTTRRRLAARHMRCLVAGQQGVGEAGDHAQQAQAANVPAAEAEAEAGDRIGAGGRASAPGLPRQAVQAVAGGAVSSARPHMNPPCMRFLGSPVEYPLK